jgi:hypothetical protein
MTSGEDDEIGRRRGAVLIGSGSAAFIDIVGQLVGECSFEVTVPAPAEPPWLAVARTQPALVICDCTSAALDVKGLMIEAVARGLPLLIVGAPNERAVARKWPLPQRIAWLELPIAVDRFRITLDALMTPRRTVVIGREAFAALYAESVESRGWNVEVALAPAT